MNGVTISRQIVRENLAGLKRVHSDWRSVLQKSGIREEELNGPGGRLPIDRVMKLHRMTLNFLDDETLGLLERRTPRGFLRQVALSTVHTRTLDRALVRLVEMINLLENTFYYVLEKQNSQTTLYIRPIKNGNQNNDFIVGWLMSIVHRLLGWLANERIVPKGISFNFPTPHYHQEYYYAFYGSPIHYDASEACMIFRSCDLELAIVQNEASVERYIRRYPFDLLIPVEMGGPMSREVRTLVVDWLKHNHEMPSIEQIADSMQRHPRTLRRQLKQERASFKTFTLQVRRDIAMYHLGHDDISIEKIAERAGYSDTSSFIRVFKSWTGFTPLVFRKGL